MLPARHPHVLADTLPSPIPLHERKTDAASTPVEP